MRRRTHSPIASMVAGIAILSGLTACSPDEKDYIEYLGITNFEATESVRTLLSPPQHHYYSIALIPPSASVEERAREMGANAIIPLSKVHTGRDLIRNPKNGWFEPIAQDAASADYFLAVRIVPQE